jgi:RNA polymerase sigma factor (sigma-70 family)
MTAVAVVAKTADRSMDDLGLVAAVRAGDDRAFELLFERYQGRITAYVRSMVRDHGRAEDVTQEVFMAALRRMRETDREIAFKPWIYEIAKNACIDAFRRARNVQEVSIDGGDALGPADHGRLAAPGLAADAVLDTKLAIDDLCGAFGGLSRTHHDILVMREFDGLSYREIGDRLDMSRAAVESTLFRARRRLGEEYGEIASGERCLRVRGIVDAREERTVGLRDRRRMARHLSHCQPCRRYAHLAGVDLGVVGAPAAAVAKVAALLPLPVFLRRRVNADDAGQLLGAGHGMPVMHWSPSVVSAVDPATVSGWSKAVVTAATVAVAGLGAGAAVKSPQALHEVVSQGRSIVGLGDAPAAAKTSRPRAAPGAGSSSVGSLRLDRRSAAGVTRRAGAAPSTSTAGGRDPAPAAADGPSRGLPDAGATHRPTLPLGSLALRKPDGATPAAPGGAAKHDDVGSGLLGGGSPGQSPADASGAPTDPLSLVGTILKGGSGSRPQSTDAATGTASTAGGGDAVVSTSSDVVTSSATPASADGSVSSTGIGASHRGPLAKTVGDVLGAVTGAP